MKRIITIITGLLAATLVLGLMLRAAGVNPDGKFGAGAALWPFVMPAFGGLVSLAIGIVNKDTIARLWNKSRIEKGDLRPMYALFFGPLVALLIQAYTGLDHFGLMTKAQALTALAVLQLGFFFIMGNYAATLRAGSPGGFRTPWTLKSDRVWAKTHRFIGRGLFLASLAGLPALFFLPPLSVIAGHISVVIGIKVAAAVYSYAIWRAERQRHVL